MVSIVASQRPLAGEPLSLDLVNTEWVDRGCRQDLLANCAGMRDWLKANRIAVPRARANEARAHLLEARAALRALLEGDGSEQGRERLNAVLERGCVHHRLVRSGAVEEIDAPEAWRPAWQAAFDYANLIRRWPRWRIKGCAHPDCILFFLDTSRNGTRRWCDMRSCGNRFKVQQHYRRKKGACET